MRRFNVEKYVGAVAPGGVTYPTWDITFPCVLTHMSFFSTEEGYFTLYRTSASNMFQVTGDYVNDGKMWSRCACEIAVPPGKYLFGFYNLDAALNAEMHVILSFKEDDYYQRPV